METQKGLLEEEIETYNEEKIGVLQKISSFLGLHSTPKNTSRIIASEDVEEV